ncbi:glycosyltransferase family 2 protein [Leptospira fletcheri]|uniref:Glycosyltransferase family 2 protein n=1 Tax=Leptospira fletcheri TaxID=2484981 RepID=A0A4R9GDM0_9LEPT|nr:glycosyltransferase [Leptospira fletcheri]TGK09948.1 glycosyltransferase family 2 protein [Leptospira fletcheri]
MKNEFAPIALFAYRRLAHTKRTIEALLENAESKYSEIFLFCDGPKNKEVEDSVLEVRNYLSIVSGFKSVKLIFRERNLGLAKSILTGVTEVLAQYDSVIVLEDDIVTHPQFLTYMNYYLKLYENDDRISCISGYSYPIADLPEFFFLKGADCWGWASWSRVWSRLNSNGSELLHQIEGKNLENDFDFYDSFPYTQMLRDQIQGKNDSWAIRWYADCFLKNLLCLYPGRSLVQNIGLDLTGTHSGLNMDLSPEVSKSRFLFTPNLKVEESIVAKKKFARYFKPRKFPFFRLIRRIILKLR